MIAGATFTVEEVGAGVGVQVGVGDQVAVGLQVVDGVHVVETTTASFVDEVVALGVHVGLQVVDGVSDDEDDEVEDDEAVELVTVSQFCWKWSADTFTRSEVRVTHSSGASVSAVAITVWLSTRRVEEVETEINLITRGQDGSETASGCFTHLSADPSLKTIDVDDGVQVSLEEKTAGGVGTGAAEVVSSSTEGTIDSVACEASTDIEIELKTEHGIDGREGDVDSAFDRGEDVAESK